MEFNILQIIIPAMAATIASLITAFFLRRSSKETNDTNAFKIVTDQLFKLNGELRTELDEVKTKLNKVEATVDAQERELYTTRTELEESRRVNRGLATYIKALLAAWPVGTNPPAPDPTVDWQRHL